MKKSSSIVQKAQAAIEKRSKINDDSQAIRPSNLWLRATTWTLMGTAFIAVMFLGFAQTEEIIVVTGQLKPEGDVKDVQVPLGGVVDEILVKEGEKVEAGQVLIRLDSEATVDFEKNIIESITLKQLQISLKKEELRQYLLLNDTQQNVLNKNLLLQRDILKRFSVLESEGAGSELQLLQQSDKVEQVAGELQKTIVDREMQQSVISQQIQQILSELTSLRSKLKEQSVNLRYQVIKAPIAGIIFDFKPQGVGFVAKTSEPVMKIVPLNRLEAQVEIPSSDIGFVKVGQQADLSIDSFPASDFGALEGSITSIGSDALPPDQSKARSDYSFPATIELNSQKLNVKNGRSLPLQVGMTLSANIKLRQVSYLQLLIGKFKDKTDSLREI
ncbi:HlyD family secretion protein [Synechococcus sp. WH 8016]|uniref:HlyD family secretion protein n=1 Tax=Synechococcus sp. WH 8016 TaxID=166318 RepID=UPI00022D7F01|nr:HlyD family efflux transporter periplasmic adaptor subunit [Synechococcus sp. WH 8016]EHA62525.1 secretion protein HlyD family protein [Synechococcus sp. WH 8016]